MRQQVYQYIAEQYGVSPEYLWQKFPEYAVWRHVDNRKWFALLMNIPREKIMWSGTGAVDILDLKCDPKIINQVLDEPGIIPGYHMHKGNWLTVVLDGSCPLPRVCELIDQSYQITAKKR